MAQADLLWVCITAFISVGVLLGFLAVVIRLILAIFPHKTPVTDPAVVAAVTSAVQAIYPATQVTRVEEIQ